MTDHENQVQNLLLSIVQPSCFCWLGSVIGFPYNHTFWIHMSESFSSGSPLPHMPSQLRCFSSLPHPWWWGVRESSWLQYRPRQTNNPDKEVKLRILRLLIDVLGVIYSKKDGDILFCKMDNRILGLEEGILNIIQSKYHLIL